MNQAWFQYKILPPKAAKDFLHNLKDFIWGCVRRFLTALRAELCFERHVVFTISLREIVKTTCLSEEYWGCVKRFFMALRAKLYLDVDIFLLILLRKISKKMSTSKEYFAAAGGENLFTQPQRLFLRTATC
jgi:hypothetical protein